MVDGDEPQYRTNTIRTIRGLEARSIAKQEVDGWELVSQTSGQLRSELTFRKPKPKAWWRSLPAPLSGMIQRVISSPWSKWIAGLAVLLVLAGIITVNAVRENSQAPVAAPTPTTSATPAPSATPTRTPTPSPTAVREAETVPEAEIVGVFQSYFAERAAAGVVLAKTVSSVTYVDRVVTIVFDPAVGGFGEGVFESALEGWDNLAKLAATPVAFRNEVGERFRPVIDSIVTVAADGTPLGTYSAAQVLALNELEK